MATKIKKSDFVSGQKGSIRMIGDSLTNPLIPYILRGLSDYRMATFEGIGGQDATQIACRQGGWPIYVTVSGNVLTGATAANITAISTQFLSTPATTAAIYSSGMIADVHCQIERTVVSSVETYKILGYNNSTAAIPANSIFYPDQAINAMNDVHVMMWGKNGTAGNNLLDLYDKAVTFMQEPRRFIVLGILNSLDQTIGTAGYISNIASNDAVRAAYPNNYVEITPPTTEEMAYIKYTPSTQDLTEIANGVFPNGMRLDNVHVNGFGSNIIANRIIKKLNEYNW